VFEHTLAATLRLNQPWGSVRATLSGSCHINDTAKNSLMLSNSMSLRLGRGFAFNVYLSYSRINNQLALRREDATDEEILLRLRQLRTSYSYYGNLGVSYTFGSIFNSAVNPRFAGVGFY